MSNNIVLDETLRYLYIAVRNKGASLVAIKFIHRGKKWEADTPEEAVRLRRELEAWDEADAEEGVGMSAQEVRAESVWTPDTFWNFVNDIGSHQKKAVIALLHNHGSLKAADLAEGIGIEEGALGGVLSGLSKQLKQLELKPYDLYRVHTDWTNGERKRLFFLQRAFRLAAEEVGWPEERKKENAASTKNKRK
jgi:hypothetical protein